jgi:hypothetical protein
MKNSILLLLLLLTACATPEEIQRQQEAEARLTPKQRCENYVNQMAQSCALLCLSQIVSNNPNGQSCLNQCSQNQMNNLQSCSAR